MSKRLENVGQFHITGNVTLEPPDGTVRRPWTAIVNLTPSIGFSAPFGASATAKSPEVAIARAARAAVHKARYPGRHIAPQETS